MQRVDKEGRTAPDFSAGGSRHRRGHLPAWDGGSPANEYADSVIESESRHYCITDSELVEVDEGPEVAGGSPRCGASLPQVFRRAGMFVGGPWSSS